MQLYPVQTFQRELSKNLNSKVNEIMEFYLNQTNLIAAHNSIDQIVEMETIFHGLDFNILQMPLHLLMQLFHRH